MALGSPAGDYKIAAPIRATDRATSNHSVRDSFNWNLQVETRADQ